MTSAHAGRLVAANQWGHGAALFKRHDAPAAGSVQRSVAALSAPAHELSREVYCLQGIPVDAVDMSEVVRRIETAAATRSPFLISTPNINFLIGSRNDETFRESLLCSDLCPADGMPLVWIAKLTGVPIKKRVAGSDIFEVLKAVHDPANRLKLYLFGGGEGAATAAAQALNAKHCGWNCVGRMNPGFGPVESMSSKEIIDEINASDADFLAVALGAAKGQTWLLKNHHRLQVPIRAHLGATVNFLSGRVRRAPRWMRLAGLEWLWRIKEEPHLWKRYGKDGLGLLGLMVSQVLPLAILTQWEWLCRSGERQALATEMLWRDRDVTLRLSGAATERHVKQAISSFIRLESLNPTSVTIDVSKVTTVDARFLGLLLVLWKLLRVQDIPLTMHGATRRLRMLFRLQGVGYLLSSQSA